MVELQASVRSVEVTVVSPHTCSADLRCANKGEDIVWSTSKQKCCSTRRTQEAAVSLRMTDCSHQTITQSKLQSFSSYTDNVRLACIETDDTIIYYDKKCQQIIVSLCPCKPTHFVHSVNCQAGSEKAAFPTPVVRDLGKAWIRAPTETNNGSYERRGEGRPNANIHFVRLGEPAPDTVNYQLPRKVSEK